MWTLPLTIFKHWLMGQIKISVNKISTQFHRNDVVLDSLYKSLCMPFVLLSFYFFVFAKCLTMAFQWNGYQHSPKYLWVYLNILRQLKPHVWMTGVLLLWHPSSASVLRSWSKLTSALFCLPHSTLCSLHTGLTAPLMMPLLSPYTLLSLPSGQ